MLNIVGWEIGQTMLCAPSGEISSCYGHHPMVDLCWEWMQLGFVARYGIGCIAA